MPSRRDWMQNQPRPRCSKSFDCGKQRAYHDRTAERLVEGWRYDQRTGLVMFVQPGLRRFYLTGSHENLPTMHDCWRKVLTPK